MNSTSFYVTGDFLYWRAENQGFSYAYDVESASQNVGRIARVHPEWAPAFRAGLGWNSRHDFWDVLFNYTWYLNHASETRTSANGFFRMWPISQTVDAEYTTVLANFRVMMNMGDWEIGRMAYLTKSMAIRPYWGVKGGTLHQKFKNNFTDPLSDLLPTSSLFNGKNNYWGVGPRLGLQGEWHVSKGFSLLGKTAGALLYGKTKVKNIVQTLAVGQSSLTLNNYYKDDFYQLVPNLQLSVGFQYQTCFSCEKMFYKMSVSWEANYWWNQFNIPFSQATFSNPFPTVSSQPLTMEGLTVNAEWDF